MQLALGAAALWAALMLASAYSGSAAQLKALQNVPVLKRLLPDTAAPPKEAESAPAKARPPERERHARAAEAAGSHRP